MWRKKNTSSIRCYIYLLKTVVYLLLKLCWNQVPPAMIENIKIDHIELHKDILFKIPDKELNVHDLTISWEFNKITTQIYRNICKSYSMLAFLKLHRIDYKKNINIINE